MSIVISEFIDYKKGKLLLWILEITSIVFWVKLGDLRLYALVQFYLILSIPVILILFKSEENLPNGFWFLWIPFVIAKLFETYDFEIHNKVKFLSGHSLKHITVSIGIFLLINSCIRHSKIVVKQLPT